MMKSREYQYFSKPLYSTIQFWVSIMFLATAAFNQWNALRMFRSKYTVPLDVYLSMLATIALLIFALAVIALQHRKVRRALKEQSGEQANEELVVAAFEVVKVFYVASGCVFLSMTMQMLLFGHTLGSIGQR